MAQTEEVGVEAVVLGFPLFMAQMGAIAGVIAGAGAGGTIAAVGIGALSLALLGIGAVVAGAGLAIAGLVGGFAALSVASFDIAASVESAFAGVAKTTPGLLDEFGQMTEAGERVRDEFRRLAFEVPLALEDLLEIGQFAGQLGIAEEALAGFTEVAAALAVSTDLTAESATFALARIANIFDVQSEDMVDNAERLGSSVVFLGNNFATTESEILNFARRLAPTANVVGMTQDQVVAFGAAFTAAGVEIQAGSTAVQTTLSTMAMAVVDSGEELDIFAETAGVSAEEFARVWETDAAEAFLLFSEGLGRAGQNAFTILDDLSLGSRRTSRALLAVANTGDLLSDALDGSSTATAENTALAREAQIRYQTFDSKLQIFKNTIRDVGLQIGDILLPFMKELLEIATPIITAIGEGLVPAFENIAGSIEKKLLPALGGLLEAFGFDISTSDLTTSITNWGDTAAEGIEAFSRFVDDVARAVKIFKEEGAVASLSEFFGVDEQVINNFFDVAKGITAFTLALTGLFVVAKGAAVLGTVVTFLLGLGKVIAGVLAGGTLAEAVAVAFGLTTAGVTSLFVGVLAIAIAALIAAIVIYGPKAWKAIVTIWDGILIIVGKFLEDMVELVSEPGWFDRVVAVFGEIATQIADKVIEWLAPFFDNFARGLEEGWIKNVEEPWNKFWADLGIDTFLALAKIGQIIREKLEEWGIDVDAALVLLDQIMRGDWETIGNTIAEAWDTMKARIDIKIALIKIALLIWARDILLDMINKVNEWTDIGRDWMNGLLRGLQENGQLIIDFLLNLAQETLDAILDFWGEESPSTVMAEIGENMMKGLAKGIADNAKLPQVALDMANAQTMRTGMGVLNGASPGGATNSVDRSLNVDMIVNAQPQAPNRIVDDLALLTQLS